MDEVVNNIKQKLSTDNLVEMMKDAKVIDNERVKEENVRKTLEKINMDHFIHTEELAEKLNEITEAAAAVEDANKVTVIDTRNSLFSVLGQSTEQNTYDLPTTIRNDEDYMIKDNVTGFLD